MCDRFPNVAAKVGLDPQENMAGGSIADDFTGDGLVDVFISTSDPTRGSRLFVNLGNGSFEERSEEVGLADQVAALNCSQADYDNDGDLDIFLMRGGWEKPLRPSLLRNDGKGTFTDVTVESGMATPIACQSAAWGDYDNDGHLDLYACGEYLPPQSASVGAGTYSYGGGPDPRNYCRLYHNNGNGKFTDVADAAGVAQSSERPRGPPGAITTMMAGWISMSRTLARKTASTTTTATAHSPTLRRQLKVTEPLKSFSCWFFDYDNDGRLDIYVTGFAGTLNDIVRSQLGQPTGGERPRLYHNEGASGFRDVTLDAGLDRVILVMGSNFGDIDNDGYLDIYLGTGQPACFYVVPNVLLRNVGGTRFEDVTVSSGTGHLQKGHGISFADWDRDGDVDIFLASGGATPGDKAHNVLFQNPGHGNHWINVKLSRHPVQPCRHRGRDPGRACDPGWQEGIALSDHQQRVKLWRQQPRHDDRTGPGHFGDHAGDPLANQRTAPGVPQRARGSRPRDHRRPGRLPGRQLVSDQAARRGEVSMPSVSWRRQAKELVDRQPDVGGAHQCFAHQDGRDARVLEPLHVATSPDAALADEHDPRRDLIAQVEGMLKVGGEAAEVAIVDPDEVGPRGQDARQIARVVKLDEGRHPQLARRRRSAVSASSSRISAIRRMASAPASRASTT